MPDAQRYCLTLYWTFSRHFCSLFLSFSATYIAIVTDRERTIIGNSQLSEGKTPLVHGYLLYAQLFLN